MSENQTSSTPEASTSAPSQSTEKVKINLAGSGGGFGFDEFNRAIGAETDNTDEPDEPEVEEGSGELLDEEDVESSEEESTGEKDEESSEEGDEEDSEESDEEESDEEEVALEELGKGLKKGVKAFTKDGKEVTLPPDLEIEQVIDGEVRKINLREHLNVVAGEETVKSRLGKISSFREQVEQRYKHIESIHANFQNRLNTLVSFAKEGKPDLAIAFLAEMNGTSPIQMKRKFLDIIVAEAMKFEGKSEAEIDNYYLNLERDWRERKERNRREQMERQHNANKFVDYVTKEIQKEDLYPDEFIAAQKELAGNGELEGLSRDAAVDRVIEHALYRKHHVMARTAISSVDPKLVNNQKILDVLLDITHPNKFTVEEMADVVREYLGKTTARIASSLSKKVKPGKVLAKTEKQNEAGKKQRTFKNQGDLARAFGL